MSSRIRKIAPILVTSDAKVVAFADAIREKTNWGGLGRSEQCSVEQGEQLVR